MFFLPIFFSKRMKDRLVWFKERIVPLQQAKINALSPTAQFGANVFEGLRGYWSESDSELYIFRLKDHIKRLQKSIELVGFESDFTDTYLYSAVMEAVRANKFKEDIVCRQIVFLDGFGSWSSKSPVNMLVAPMTKGRYIGANEGLKVCISSWERINERSLPPSIKMGANYMNSRFAQLEAIRKNFDSAIFLNNQGNVSEGPGACVFIVKDKRLITPPLTASILDSITRSTVIQIAEDLKLGIDIRDVIRSELLEADEIFMCGTAVEIAPVFSIDGVEVGNGLIGELTEKIRCMYFEIIYGKNKRYLHWLSPVYKI